MSNSILSFDIYQQRLDRTAELLRSRDAGAAVFGTNADLQYLTNSAVTSHERLTAPVVATVGTTTLVLPAAERRDLPLRIIGDLNADVMLWKDGENPRRVIADLVGHVDTFVVGASLTTDHLIPIQDLTGTRTVLAGDLLKELFVRKDATEIDQLCKADAVIDRVHAHVPGMLRTGHTKRKVADEVSAAILEEGHVTTDFVIVGSAKNGADPHHDSSGRIIEEGDVVVVDTGGASPLDYHSDCTRTYVVGKPGEKEAVAQAALRKAQEVAMAAVHPSVAAAEIDAIVRNSLAAAGYDEYFIHRADHGIGLSTYEEPFIMADNELKPEPGMVFSVEPGVYLSGEFGMRLKDIIIVTEDGGESVNSGPHDLVTV